MEDKFEKVSEEAINDLSSIFDEVVVDKIILKHEGYQKELLTKLKIINEEMSIQGDILLSLEEINYGIGKFDADNFGEEKEGDAFCDLGGKLNLASVITGLVQKQRSTANQIVIVKEWIGTPYDSENVKNTDKKKITTLFSLIDYHASRTTFELKEIVDHFDENNMNKAQLEKAIYSLKKNQENIANSLQNIEVIIEKSELTIRNQLTYVEKVWRESYLNLEKNASHYHEAEKVQNERLKGLIENVVESNEVQNKEVVVMQEGMKSEIKKWIQIALVLNSISITGIIALIILYFR